MNKKTQTPEERINNLRCVSWYYEQQYKIAFLETIPADKLNEIIENCKAAILFMQAAREKIHPLEYHAGELTQGPVSLIRRNIDNIIDSVSELLRSVTPIPENQRFILENYPLY